jgi:hypothetical protein
MLYRILFFIFVERVEPLKRLMVVDCFHTIYMTRTAKMH